MFNSPGEIEVKEIETPEIGPDEVLKEGRIAAAALDIHEDEPLPEGSLWLGLENVTFTSHIAGTTMDTWQNSVRMVAEAIREFSETGRCQNTVNAESLERA